jgi:hypothetical protein
MFKRTSSLTSFRRPWAVALTALTLGFALQPSFVSAQQAQEPMPDSVAVRRNARAQVEVNSANWLDSHVYVVRDGLVTSIGFVMGPGKSMLTLPSLAMVPGSSLQLMVLPVGSRGMYVSPSFSVSPGDLVRLQIENNLALSTLVIAPR